MKTLHWGSQGCLELDFVRTLLSEDKFYQQVVSLSSSLRGDIRGNKPSRSSARMIRVCSLSGRFLFRLYMHKSIALKQRLCLDSSSNASLRCGRRVSN